MIFSTHVMENAERMCDAVCIISRGEKVLDGPVSDVRSAQSHHTVALTFEVAPPEGALTLLRDPARVARSAQPSRQMEFELHDHVDAQQLLAELLAAGARLERFELVRPSLHRIFLEKVGANGVETGLSGHG